MTHFSSSTFYVDLSCVTVKEQWKDKTTVYLFHSDSSVVPEELHAINLLNRAVEGQC